MAQRIDVPPGTRFGRLIVVSEAETHRTSPTQVARRFACRCDCGNECIVRLGNLRRGNTTSCGCAQVEAARKPLTHGMAGTQMYRAWNDMIQRCYNQNRPRYTTYGARGLTVCQRWRDSFEAFLEDMGKPPTENHSLDREDNNKGYSKDNCRWATRQEQARNTRRNVRLTHQGETLCLSEWAIKIGMNYGTLYDRLKKGWSVEDALTIQVRKRQ